LKVIKNIVYLFIGQWSDMVISTIDLGISILMGGNTIVQKVYDSKAWLIYIYFKLADNVQTINIVY